MWTRKLREKWMWYQVMHDIWWLNVCIHTAKCMNCASDTRKLDYWSLFSVSPRKSWQPPQMYYTAQLLALPCPEVQQPKHTTLTPWNPPGLCRLLLPVKLLLIDLNKEVSGLILNCLEFNTCALILQNYSSCTSTNLFKGWLTQIILFTLVYSQRETLSKLYTEPVIEANCTIKSFI